MRIGWGNRIATGVALVAMSGNWAGQGSAQDAGPSAFSITGTIRGTVEIDDNGGLSAVSPGTDLTFGTDIDLVFTLERPRANLTFEVGGRVQAEDLAASREENGFVDPSARLSYRLEGVDSLLALEGDYRKSDVANSFSFDSDSDLINDTFLSSVGDIETYGASLDLSLGIDAPIGVDIALSRRVRDYSDTVDPELYDRTTDTARVTGRFRVSDTATARLFAEEERYDAEDPGLFTDRTTRTIGAGLEYQINPVLTFSGEIGVVTIDESTLLAPNATSVDDFSVDASLTQELPNGTVGLTLERVVGTTVTRTDLSVERAMDLPAGALSFGLGYSQGSTGGNEVIGFVDYTHEFPGAILSLSAERSAEIASDNAQSTLTRLGLSYDRDLTPVSGVVLEVDYFDRSGIGAGGSSDGTRADLSLTYRQELTEDWDWSIGYVGRRSEDSAGVTATSNALVFSVGRSFSLRP